MPRIVMDTVEFTMEEVVLALKSRYNCPLSTEANVTHKARVLDLPGEKGSSFIEITSYYKGGKQS